MFVSSVSVPRYCCLAEFYYLACCTGFICIDDCCILKFMFRVRFVVVGPVVCCIRSGFFSESLSIALALDSFFLLFVGEMVFSFYTRVVCIVLIGSPFSFTVMPCALFVFYSYSFQPLSYSSGLGTCSRACDFLWVLDYLGTELDGCFF